MSAAAPPAPPSAAPAAPASEAPAAPLAERRRFDNGLEWIQSLGNVPIHRIVFDPWPGTATETDLLRLVEVEKRLCELIDGTLVEKAVGLHQAGVNLELATDLKLWNRQNGDRFIFTGADSTLRMGTVDRIRLPDLCAFHRSRLPNGKLPPEPVPTISPDLAVEILSPSNTRSEMRQKLGEYFDNGTRLAWLIDPQRRTVAVYTAATETPDALLRDGDDLSGGDLLPNFSMPVATLWKETDR